MKRWTALLIFAGGLYAGPQILGCLAAVVNSKPVTLLDVRIAERFGIYDEEIRELSGGRRRLILERIIDQKAVLGLIPELKDPEEALLAAAVDEIAARLGPEEFSAALRKFGLNRSDLADYLKEDLLFRKVLVDRFEHGVTVSLQEIESHYRDVYIPAMKDSGRQPEPLLQILDDLETDIKKIKKTKMIAEWISHIRSQTEIRILTDCLDIGLQEGPS